MHSGFPRAFVSQLQQPDRYPQFTFTDYMQTGINEWDIAPSDTYSVQTGMNHSLGQHT